MCERGDGRGSWRCERPRSLTMKYNCTVSAGVPMQSKYKVFFVETTALLRHEGCFCSGQTSVSSSLQKQHLCSFLMIRCQVFKQSHFSCHDGHNRGSRLMLKEAHLVIIFYVS